MMGAAFVFAIKALAGLAVSTTFGCIAGRIIAWGAEGDRP